MTLHLASRVRHAPVVSLAVAGLAVVVVGVPFWIVIVNSFKPYLETTPPNLALPVQWQGSQNYEDVLSQSSVLRGYLNTGIVLLGTIPLTLLLSAAAAWVFVRAQSRALRVIYYAMLIGVAIPPAIVASIFVLKAIGAYGGLFGLSALYCAWYIPLGIFLMTGFVRTIPVELEDAARIDGASNFAVFVRIVLPLLSPVLITTSLILVIALWNDYLNPFMMLNSPTSETLTLTLFDFATGSRVAASYQWNLVFADIVLSSLPMIVVYYFSQRYIVYGLAGVGK